MIIDRELMVFPLRIVTLVALAGLASAGCDPSSPHTPPEPTTAAPSGTTSAPPSAVARGYGKLLMIVEENRGYDQIFDSPDAPYLHQLAGTYGSATNLDAGYRPECPSLAAYIQLTSGTTAGICDDRAPQDHPLRGDNLFHQISAGGGEWRAYAESSPGPCAPDNSSDGRYLVRHVPSTYYVDDRADCARWTVPMGRPKAGALADDIAAGTLPAFALITPDACHDMHGAPPCRDHQVLNGDTWLRDWIPQILAGPDYRNGRLAIVITWDEGTSTDNHIPTLVISPTSGHVSTGQAFTHCSILRTVEESLHLALLGCAATAPSMAAAFRLR